MQECPWVLHKGLLFILAWEFGCLLSFSSACVGSYSLDRVLLVLPGRWRQWRASNQCLVLGPLTVARTCVKVVQAAPSCRAELQEVVMSFRQV